MGDRRREGREGNGDFHLLVCLCVIPYEEENLSGVVGGGVSRSEIGDWAAEMRVESVL